MIEVEETADGLRAIDLAKKEVEIGIDGWASGGDEFEIDRRVHATVAGVVGELRFPFSAVTVEERDGSSWQFPRADERTAFESGQYLIQTDNVMTVFVRTNAAFALEQDSAGERTTITFPERTALTFGFRSYEKRPDGTVRIPPTPEGLASALTAVGDYHETETPDRSYPSMRLHPPLLEVDGAARPQEATPGSSASVRLDVPASFDDLFSVAPLAYYLGAEVTVGDGHEPSILAGGEQVRPSPGTPVPEWAGSLLMRVFYLDCLVRNVGPYGAEIAELGLLDEISLDAEDAYELPIGRRLVEYVDVDFERIADGFPPWPLSVSVDPRPSNVPAIPHLLNKLAIIHLPVSEIMDRREFISQSLDDFDRSRGVASAGPDAEGLTLHMPRRNRAVSHGWIAGGAIADGFKCTPGSLANGLTRREEGFDELSVVVVVNERDMDAELADVVRTFDQFAGDLPISVQADAQLMRRELGNVFEAPHDYVHYIGHCDENGLRCVDGNLDVDTLDESRAKMFFLNACGSYEQGLSLVRNGSIAGTVTTSDVIDDQARRVGATLAKLLTSGFSLDRSVRLARRRSIMNRRYIVLGDGTRSLTQAYYGTPTLRIVKNGEDESYSVRYHQDRYDFQGGIFQAIRGTGPVLLGNQDETEVSARSLREILEHSPEPILYEDTLYWPDELCDELF